MRENRTYGSEGGASGNTTGRSYPYPVPPNWVSGGAANRCLGAIGRAFLRNVTAPGCASWLEATPR